MFVRSPRTIALAAWLTALVVSACSTPPNKEVADANTALSAARNAGAERYAPEPYAAAAEAYRLANEAVLAGDYRLALNHALDSRERAQNAARAAAAVQLRARDTVEGLMVDVATLLASAGARIEEAERAGAARSAVRAAREAVALVNDDVQKAGAAMAADDYAGAEPLLMGVKAQISAVLASLDQSMPAQSRKPAR
jgi:hypothetical protein